MITVKQYAEERGITIQAVHQSMSGKRKQAKLKGHVQVIDGVKWLDEEAVAILDEHRNKNPIVIVQQDKDEAIEAMRLKLEELLVERAELYKWKADNAMAIAEANHTKLLLEGTKAELEAAKRDAAEQAVVLGLAQKEAEASKKRAEEAEARERALKERNMWQRIVRKGE